MKRLLALLLLIPALNSCLSAKGVTYQTQTGPVPPEAWWRHAVFYEIFVRSFYDSNADGIGDFNGLAQKLDYLKSLGITGLWLMPIHPSPSYHGYDVLNYYNVNPEYGTMGDFRHFLGEAHQRGMRVIIDLVLNHTSNRHPFFVDALRGPGSKYHDWYVWSDTDQGNGWHPAAGNTPGYYYGLFCDCMPDLNYRNPEVTVQMENIVRFWLDDVGVDGFRIDAAKHLIEEGNKIENTNSTHEWYKGFHRAYKTDRPDAYAVGEVYGAGGLIARTYTGDQLDQVFNFELASGFVNSAAGGANSGINSAWTFTLKDMPDGNYATFLTNHDQNRVMSDLNGNIHKAKLAAFFLLTSPGTPFIYYGEEIGMQGRKPDEDIRRPMQWSGEQNGGFTTRMPWRAPADDFAAVNVAAEINDPNSLLTFYRELITIRQGHSALRTGRLILLDSGNPAVYAALRADDSETILVMANLGNESIRDYGLTSQDASLPEGDYSLSALLRLGDFADLQVSAAGKFVGYRPLPDLPPYSAYILKVDLAR